MQKQEYDKLKEVCNKEPQCYCPKEHEASFQLANIPEWIRRYYSDKEANENED